MGEMIITDFNIMREALKAARDKTNDVHYVTMAELLAAEEKKKRDLSARPLNPSTLETKGQPV